LLASSAFASLQNGQVFVSAAASSPDEHLRELPHDEGDDDEDDHRVDERAVADRHAAVGVQVDHELREIDPAEQKADRRHDDVVDQRGDDCAQRGADDHADRQGERVGLQQELAELSGHGALLHPSGRLRRRTRHRTEAEPGMATCLTSRCPGFDRPPTPRTGLHA
jgi:hypothetical protein